MRTWFLLLAVAACSHAADLTFERSDLEVSPKLGDAAATATYRFTATAAQPVRVSVKTSCACLTATLDRDTYQPGEHGVLIADFAIGPLVGEQTKSITVTTEPAGEAPIRLTLTAHVPGPKLDGDEIAWSVGETTTTIKAVTLTLPGDGAFEIVDARSRTGAFLVSVNTTEDKHVFKISVQPFDTRTAKDDAIDLITKPASQTTFRARVVAAAATMR
jgi:hypothetical protein